jgi:NADPH:quinone reductase-like Zn-dependent oxidoreductase
MKAIVLDRYGTPDRLKLQEVERPAPKAGEVLVRVHAASINDWDYAIIDGSQFIIRVMHGLVRPKVRILGGDIAGRVEAIGAGVTTCQPGDEVYGDLCMNGFGAFAEYACAPETCLVRKPASMRFEQAAAIPQAGMLAVQGLIDVGRIQSGQKVLLNGAGGGVGTFALQIAKLHGVEVTVVDRADKLEMLRLLGADQVIDYQKEDFTRNGKGYDLILDVKTNRSPRAYTRALNPGGTYVTVGGSIPRLIHASVVGAAISRLGHRHLRMVGLKPNKDLAYMNSLFEAGKMTPVIDGPYRLGDLVEAFRLFASGAHKGKIIVSVA